MRKAYDSTQPATLRLPVEIVQKLFSTGKVRIGCLPFERADFIEGHEGMYQRYRSIGVKEYNKDPKCLLSTIFEFETDIAMVSKSRRNHKGGVWVIVSTGGVAMWACRRQAI